MIGKWEKIIGLACLALALTFAQGAVANSAPAKGDVTFTKDVLPILQENCQICHRPGGANMGGMVAPMPFTTYRETRPWAKAIAKAVANRIMPPWHPSEEFSGIFENERGLTDSEIETLVAWVEQGAARGNPADAPAPVEWPVVDGWTIGEPDLVVSMPEPFFVPDDLRDDTFYFPMTISKEDLPEDRWIKAVEFKPGSEVVHHIIASPMGGIAPGNGPTFYREGYGALLKSGQEVVWNMHYHKEPGPGTGVWDQSKVAVKFYPKGYTPKHVLTTDPLGSFGIDIKPGQKDFTLKASLKMEKDALLVSMLPHMHYRGTAARYTLYYPDGSEEVMLDIPRYDYNWQITYRFKEPKLVPKGTRVEFQGWWDNSADNPLNPDPNRHVKWGEGTDAEMLFGWLSWTHPDEDASAHQGIRSSRAGGADRSGD